jgi:NAD(P)-dependent dehydrogenase (short-subunit alcohol dehydrogenase family)
MFNLAGKKALVTGGSRGIGRGVVLALAEQGADVIVNFHSHQEEADEVVSKVKEMGRESWAIQADVSQYGEVGKMFAQVKEKWGKLDILVNNAGILSYGEFEKLTEEQWDQVLGVNLKGQFLCAQQAAKLMEINGWGRIINIASISSGGVGVGFLNLTHYTASKGGVVGMTENMALELAKKGINVNAIAPGAIETDMAKGVLDDEKTKQALLARVPKGRIGQPKDIGAAAAFLSSEEADYVNGVVLYVDGGWLVS